MNNMNKRVLAVQLPAPCPLACGFCRTPQHDEGDPEAVYGAVIRDLPGHQELYLTSNGETGLSTVFRRLVQFATGLGVKISVLCATERSIVPGLCRVEVSLNEFTRPLALRAIEKAKALGVPVVVSIVNDSDELSPTDLEKLADEHGAAGVIARGRQKEGRSATQAGKTLVYQRPGIDIGSFPISAYSELAGFGAPVSCIDHFGRSVALLGSPA